MAPKSPRSRALMILGSPATLSVRRRSDRLVLHKERRKESDAEARDRLLRIVDVGALTENAEIFVAYLTARTSAKLRSLVDWLRRSFGTPPH
jgi:hypothetical protein